MRNLGFGMMRLPVLSGPTDFDYEQLNRMVDAFLAAGYTYFDTSYVYHEGKSEEATRKALVERHPRDSFTVATKFPTFLDIPEDRIEETFQSQLDNLGVDYIDYYLLHNIQTVYYDGYDGKGGIVKTTHLFDHAKKWKDDGKIRHIGVSNYPVELMKEAEKYAEIEVIQPPYSMVDRSVKDELEHAKSLDMGVMSYGSIGGGFLTGRYRERPDWPEDDFRFTFYDYFNEPKFSKGQVLLKVMDQIAEVHGVPVGQVAINWNIQCGLVDTAILGASKVHHANENCDAAEWCLSEEEMAVLNAAVEGFER